MSVSVSMQVDRMTRCFEKPHFWFPCNDGDSV